MVSNQFFSFIIYTISGFIISIIFDFFRAIRKSTKTTKLLVIIEDVIFWIIASFISIYMIIHYNSGELRLYIFIGFIVGSVLYYITISSFLIKILVFIFNNINKILAKLVKLLLKIINKPINFYTLNLKKIRKIKK